MHAPPGREVQPILANEYKQKYGPASHCTATSWLAPQGPLISKAGMGSEKEGAGWLFLPPKRISGYHEPHHARLHPSIHSPSTTKCLLCARLCGCWGLHSDRDRPGPALWDIVDQLGGKA